MNDISHTTSIVKFSLCEPLPFIYKSGFSVAVHALSQRQLRGPGSLRNSQEKFMPDNKYVQT